MFSKSRSLAIAVALMAAPIATAMAQSNNPTGNMGSNGSATASPGTADTSSMNTTGATGNYSGSAMSSSTPGATGRTVVPGTMSTQAGASSGTVDQKTGSQAAGAR